MTPPSLYTPFTGTLQLPGQQLFGTDAPVSLSNGEQVAMVRWHRWSTRARFDILDPEATTVLASGERTGFWDRRFALTDTDDSTLLSVQLGIWGVGKASVTLADGAQLTARGNWSGRKFSIEDTAGAPVARMVATSAVLTLRPDSFALELLVPRLSVIQAVGLVQCIRAALEAQRSSSVAAPS